MKNNFKYILLLMLSVTFISACNKDDSSLKNQDFNKLAAYIYDNGMYIVKYDPCVLSWAYPKKSNTTVKVRCDEQAFKIANELSKNGFGEVSSDDIHYPEFWAFYDKYYQEKEAKRKPFEMPKW